jgi:hypothetical protein
VAKLVARGWAATFVAMGWVPKLVAKGWVAKFSVCLLLRLSWFEIRFPVESLFFYMRGVSERVANTL